MGNEAFTEAQEKQIVEVIRATVAEVLRQQEAKKQCGDTESQARVAAQLEQIRAEQAAEHDDPIRAMFRRMGEELERKTNDTEQRVIVTVRRVRQI